MKYLFWGKKTHTYKAQCVKNKVQTLLFCLYKGTSLFIPKTFLLKKQKQNSFLMTICTDRSNKKKGIEDRQKERQRRERQNVKGDKRYRTTDKQRQHKGFCKRTRKIWGANRTRCRRPGHGGKGGYTAVRFLLITSRASAEEVPLFTKERGGLQYSTVSAL